VGDEVVPDRDALQQMRRKQQAKRKRRELMIC
jgi:hypothetical protein